jgi:DNA-binding IclR family transcriptional regulator
MAKAKNPVRTVEHTLAILEELKERQGAGVSELAQSLDLTKGTIHNHLATLAEHGYVTKTDQEYRLGLRWLSFGGLARDREPLYKLARDAANELAEETGEYSLLAREMDGRNIYLYMVFSGQAVAIDSYLGIQYPLHCTASGKAILSRLPEPRVEEIVAEHGLPGFTANTVTDEASLFDELADIRDRGVAFDDEERINGVRAVAAPIREGENGPLLGALSVAGPTKRIQGEVFRDEYPELIHRTAQMVEINAKYQ